MSELKERKAKTQDISSTLQPTDTFVYSLWLDYNQVDKNSGDVMTESDSPNGYSLGNK